MTSQVSNTDLSGLNGLTPGKINLAVIRLWSYVF